METYYDDLQKKLGKCYVPISEKCVKLVWELFMHDKIPTEYPSSLTNDEIAELDDYVGFWYQEKLNIDKAKEYYIKAIAHGNVTAMTNLGCLYDKSGDSAKAKEYYIKAKEYYIKATAHENVTAMNNLGNLYCKLGDNEKAKEWYLKAIAHGNDSAMNNLGYQYEKSGDNEKAKEWYLKAIAYGNDLAMNNLGYLYEKSGDNEKAKEWYSKAIAHGNVTAMDNLGHLYYKLGDHEKAKEYHIKAIAHGNVNSMYNLGHLFLTQHNIVDAKKYYLMALKHDDHNHNKIVYGRLSEFYTSEYLKTQENNGSDPGFSQDFLEFLSIAKNKGYRLPPTFQFIANVYTEGIEFIDLHIKYSPDAEGAKQAKTDFVKMMNKQTKSSDNKTDTK